MLYFLYRINLLSTVQRDSPFIHITDIYCTENGLNFELYPKKKYVAPFYYKNCSSGKNCILDLSWHPTDLERALILSDSCN